MIAASIVLLRTGDDAIAITGWGQFLLWVVLIILAPLEAEVKRASLDHDPNP